MVAPKVITSGGETVAHFDLDAIVNEAREEYFTFTFKGEVFTMLPPEEADWQVTAKLGGEGGDMTSFVAELLGDDWDRFSQHKLPNAALGKLIEECQAFYGITPGESKASKRSSRSTRRR